MELKTIKIEEILKYNSFECSMPVINAPESEEDVRLTEDDSTGDITDYLVLWKIALSDAYKKAFENTREQSELKKLLFKINSQQPLTGNEYEELDRYVTAYISQKAR